MGRLSSSWTTTYSLRKTLSSATSLRIKSIQMRWCSVDVRTFSSKKRGHSYHGCWHSLATRTPQRYRTSFRQVLLRVVSFQSTIQEGFAIRSDCTRMRCGHPSRRNMSCHTGFNAGGDGVVWGQHRRIAQQDNPPRQLSPAATKSRPRVRRGRHKAAGMSVAPRARGRRQLRRGEASPCCAVARSVLAGSPRRPEGLGQRPRYTRPSRTFARSVVRDHGNSLVPCGSS